MALIVNADDFGKSREVNEAICEAFEKGIIDRTTLMTNMPNAKEAMELAKEKEFSDKIGIHLNLTSGRPLTKDMSADPVMCNSSGEFSADFARSLKTRFFLPAKTRRNVEAEIRAQFDRYKELGGTLWHVDSHHHVHTDPSIWRELKKVMRDYPVTSVRLSRNMYRGGNILMRIYKALFNASVKRFCRIRPDYFGSAEDYGQYLAVHPGFAEDHKIEIMVHPVYDADHGLADAYKGGLRRFEAFRRL